MQAPGWGTIYPQSFFRVTSHILSKDSILPCALKLNVGLAQRLPCGGVRACPCPSWAQAGGACPPVKCVAWGGAQLSMKSRGSVRTARLSLLLRPSGKSPFVRNVLNQRRKRDVIMSFIMNAEGNKEFKEKNSGDRAESRSSRSI